MARLEIGRVALSPENRAAVKEAADALPDVWVVEVVGGVPEPAISVKVDRPGPGGQGVFIAEDVDGVVWYLTELLRKVRGRP